MRVVSQILPVILKKNSRVLHVLVRPSSAMVFGESVDNALRRGQTERMHNELQTYPKHDNPRVPPFRAPLCSPNPRLADQEHDGHDGAVRNEAAALYVP